MVNNKKKRNKPRLGRNWNWARIRCNRGENDYAATSRPKFLQKRDRVGATKENGNFRFGLINRTKKKGTKTKNSSLTRIRFDRVTRIRPISIFRGVRKQRQQAARHAASPWGPPLRNEQFTNSVAFRVCIHRHATIRLIARDGNRANTNFVTRPTSARKVSRVSR